jgi:dihydroneopterin aldolase
MTEPDREEIATETEVVVEVTGLSLYTHHGVTEAEREIGQRLVIDLRLEPGTCDATVTDRVEDTVDYGEVCNVVALGAQRKSYKTLEALIAALADELIEKFGVERVWIKATKPQPPIPLAVDEVSVELWREAD